MPIKDLVKKEVRKILDEIFKKSRTLPVNFGEEILSEVTEIIWENNYDVTEENIIEALMWGYIVKMQ